jgi:hypothetical protein
VLAMTELSDTTRLYIIGRCGDDDRKAEAVARVLFQNHSQRQVATESKVPFRTLQRTVARVRKGLDRLVSTGKVSVSDLIAKG